MYDTIIVGGGTAGLSAALVLGRARRNVLILDGGLPRNAPAEAAHGVFTRDGTPPLDLLRIGREQLKPYDTVAVRQDWVTGVERAEDGFRVALATGVREQSRTLILATGVADELPDIPGYHELWGRGIFSCPYCHGWEVRDLPLGVHASGAVAMHLAPLLRNWSRDLVLLSDGEDGLTDEQRATLDALEIGIRTERIARLEGDGTGLERIVFADGSSLPLAGIFARTTQRPRNELARMLGCAVDEDGPLPGMIQVDERGATTVPGVYATGDIVLRFHQVIQAAAHGSLVAAMVNQTLVQDDVQTLQRIAV